MSTFNEWIDGQATRWQHDLGQLEADNESLRAALAAKEEDLKVNAVLLARQCDLARDAETNLAAKEAECARLEELRELARADKSSLDAQRNAALTEADQLRSECKWLREALESLSNWAKAYPLKVFPEPDFGKVGECLKRDGIALDAVSASNMRYVVVEIGKIADAALAAQSTAAQEPSQISAFEKIDNVLSEID
jgi:chromosome segregation ATPase